RQWNSYGGILGDALGGKRLILLVENLGDAQVIVQFEDGDTEVLQGRELDLGTGGNLMQMRGEFGVDLVVVDAQARLVRSPRRRRDREQKYQQSQGTRKDAQ